MSLEVHNDSKSNPTDEASPGVTTNTFIRNGLWVEGPNFLSSLELEWEDCAQEYGIRQNVSLPPGLLTKKQLLFQDNMATSLVFIVADESTPRSIWAIGRITDVFSR